MASSIETKNSAVGPSMTRSPFEYPGRDGGEDILSLALVAYETKDISNEKTGVRKLDNLGGRASVCFS
jgi:hypothetical protein